MSKPLNPAKHNRLLQQIQEIYALYQRGQFGKAQPQVARLLAKNPNSAHVHTLAAMIAVSTKQDERAMYHATTATKLDPKNTDALSTLGSLYALKGEHDQALDLYQQALVVQPEHPGALAGLGSAQSELGRYAEARETLKMVQLLSPELPEPFVNRALLELETTHAKRAIEILDSAPAAIAHHPAALDLYALAHSYDDTKIPQEVLEAHRRYGRELEAHISPETQHPNDKDPDRKLKVGYISGDLHAHSITYFLEPILEHHDKAAVEIHVFTTSSHRDEVTERLNAHADHWYDCSTMQLPDLVQFIKSHEIDILIELAGHFTGHKLPVFAARPVPVQVTFIGYGNTTGLSRIDARLIDEITDPSPDADSLATEQLVRLPGCFLCYRPIDSIPDCREPDSGRAITVGSFNNLKKLSEPTIVVWSRILNERPDVRLLLKSSRLANEELRAELVGRFANHGVDESRLDLRGFSPTVESHLDVYNDLDLALDTFPYTGTTTTCEALAMGVPVLTLLGDAHAGRVSASLLAAVGQSDMVVESESEYVVSALACIDAGRRSKSLRVSLRDQMFGSPLCDAGPYARKVEDAYRSLWSQWCGK